MRRRCMLPAIAALLLTLGAPSARAEDVFGGIRRLFEDWGLFQGMQISGQNSFTLQEHMLEGSASAFEGQRWDTASLVRRSSIHVEGPIWKNLGLQADISASGWGRSYSRYVLGWTTDQTALYWGDLSIRLAGNEFASFNKTLQGWQLDQRLPGGGLLRGFYSEEKGLTRRETISGNNTSGPFFLRYTPLIEGSEIVKVDEEVMRFGRDYRLDYETGQLWFEPVDGPPRIIPSTSVISASYQSYGWESSPGALYGARAEMPLLGEKMLLGVTALMQDKADPQQAGDTAGYQEDIYQGSGSTGPFDTNFRPILANGTTVVFEGERQTIDQTVVVLVDNVEQVQSVDYDVYHDIGRIIFRRAVPPTALVIIRYYYDLGEPVTGGDTQVLGLDLGYRINDDLTLRADWARSEQDATSSGGDALRSSLAFSRPNLTATLEIRDVQPGFSYLDTVGFQRKEKGLNAALRWQINDYISVYDRWSDLESDSGLTFGSIGGLLSTYGATTAQDSGGGSSLALKTNRNDMGIDVRYPGWPSLSFTRQTLENTGGSTTNSEQTSDMLSLRYAPQDRPFSINASLSSTDQSYLAATGDGQSGTRGASTDQMQVSATYTPTSTLSLAGHFGTNSSTSSTSGDRSDGLVTQLSARWTPSSRLSLSLDHTRSQSEGLVSSYYSPLQIDNPGGGGGGGIGDDEEPESARYEDANTQFNLSWRPLDSLNLSLSGGRRDYSSGGGMGYLADSEQTYYNASMGWQPDREWGLTATWGSDEMRFLEEGRGAVENEMLALGVNWRPEGRPWGLSLNMHQQSGSSPTYIGYGDNQVTRIVPTDLFDISGELSYEIGPGMSLFGRMGRADYDSGYANFTKDTSELGLRYRMSDLADMSLGYRFIRNISGEPELPLPGTGAGSLASQNYIAHTVMFELSSSFASGLAGRGSGYSRYGGGLSSFGGYSATPRAGYGYGTPGSIDDFSGTSTYQSGGYSGGYQGGFGGSTGYAPTPFGGTGGSMTGRSPDFFIGSEDTRGSSAVYGPATGAGQSGFETGLEDFEGQEEPTIRPPSPFEQGGRPGLPPPTDERDEAGAARRWWQWYD